MCEVLPASKNPHKIHSGELNDLLSSSNCASAVSSPTTSRDPADEFDFVNRQDGQCVGSIRTVLLIDSRTMFKFNESHVRESVNVSRCPLFEKRIRDGKMKIVEYLESRVSFGSNQDIVIYEDQQQSGEFSEFARLIYDNLWRVLSKDSEHIRIHILDGGYDAFRSEYPEHCTNGVPFVHRFMGPTCDDDETSFLNMEASEITPNIFIGGLHDASSDDLLQKLGITHIINCSRTPYERGPGYKYLPLDCADDLKQRLDEKLKPAFSLIDDAKEVDGKVLVHCYAGISRSAAIVIAYLMQNNSWSYDKCYSHVKSKRKIIAPNINFIGQLMRFERSLVIPSNDGHSDDTDCGSPPPPAAAVLIVSSRKCPAKDLTQVTTDDSSSDEAHSERTPLTDRKTPLSPVTEESPQPVPMEKSSGNCERAPPPPVKKNSMSKFMQRKQMAGLNVKLPKPKAGFRYDDIASAPIMPSGYNPFADAFRAANAERDASAGCKGCSPP